MAKYRFILVWNGEFIGLVPTKKFIIEVGIDLQ
jgi:hypothetical protein